jgi:hypothetical protein
MYKPLALHDISLVSGLIAGGQYAHELLQTPSALYDSRSIGHTFLLEYGVLATSEAFFAEAQSL